MTPPEKGQAMKHWICTFCGYSARRPFRDDLCPVCGQSLWRCEYCGGVFIAAGRPFYCHDCGREGRLSNLTPYVPDWPVPVPMMNTDRMASERT